MNACKNKWHMTALLEMLFKRIYLYIQGGNSFCDVSVTLWPKVGPLHVAFKQIS